MDNGDDDGDHGSLGDDSDVHRHPLAPRGPAAQPLHSQQNYITGFQ